MTAANYGACLAFTLKEEGGVSDVRGDPGGLTNHGITLGTFQHYFPAATAEDLETVGQETVSWIYKVGFWREVRGDDLPAGLDLMVFDAGVNEGPFRAVYQLQDILQVEDDGDIGPITLKAIASIDTDKLIGSYAARRKAYYESLDEFDTFGRGWLARLDRCTKTALAMAEHKS